MIQKINKKIFFRFSVILSSALALFAGFGSRDNQSLTNAIADGLDTPLFSVNTVFAEGDGGGCCGCGCSSCEFDPVVLIPPPPTVSGVDTKFVPPPPLPPPGTGGDDDDDPDINCGKKGYVCQ